MQNFKRELQEKKYKRIFSVEGFTTCCNSVASVKGSLTNGTPITHYCNGCGREVHILDRYQHNHKHPKVFRDYVRLRRSSPDWDHRVRLMCGMSKYFHLANGPGIIAKQERMWFTFNPKTGWLYSCKQKEGQKKRVVRNVTYLPNFWVDGFTSEMKHDFIKKCLEARTFYTWPIDVWKELTLHPQRLLTNGANGIPSVAGYIFTCLRFPAFTTLPVFDYGPPPRSMRKFLTTETRRVKVINKVFNNPGSKVVKYISNNFTNLGVMSLHWACHMLKKEHVSKLIDNDMFHSKDGEFRGSGLDPALRQKLFDKTEAWKASKPFIKEYGEKRLVNHLCMAISIMNGSRTCLGLPRNNFHYLGDAIRMWIEIKAAIPEYVVPRQGSVKDVHDRIAKDWSRLQRADVPIRYTKDEWKTNGPHGDYVFTLPMYTHDLTYVGEELRHCVGSYGRGAAARNFTIIVVHDNDGKPLVCLQVSNENRLTQAKAYGNSPPTEAEAAAIKSWCELHEVDYLNCHDLRLTKFKAEQEAAVLNYDPYADFGLLAAVQEAEAPREGIPAPGDQPAQPVWPIAEPF